VAERLYRAAPAETLRIVPLDDFTLVFHRASGLTHLVTAPAPEILAALDRPMTREGLLAALARDFDLADASTAALDARLGELVAVGLVEAA
jgi:PqqD family protein of HPr-rel-A system